MTGVIMQRQSFQLDPRTKILIMALISVAEFFYSRTAFMIAVATIPFLFLLTNHQFKTAFGYYGLFFAALGMAQIHSGLRLHMALNMVVVLLGGLVLRMFPLFAMGSYIVKSTKASEFISAMERMRISKKLTIPVSVVFRFIPTMQEESSAIKDAMQMREIQFGTKKFWQNPLALVEYRFVPLLISLVKIGNELSAAALTKGLDSPAKRTNITEVRFTYWDAIALFVVVVSLSASFLLS